MQLRRVLVIPDAHHPRVDKVAWQVFLEFAGSRRWTDVLCLGDFIDMESVSSHNIGLRRKQEGQRLASDLDSAREAWSEVVEATPGARRVVCGGNHEHRLERYLDIHPELEGSLPTLADVFELARFIPYRKHKPQYAIGRLHFIHGSYVGGGAVKRTLNELNCNIVMGHLHRLEIVTKPSGGATMMGACAGYLGSKDLGEDYMSGPTNWTTGFAHATVRPDGNFHYRPEVIVKGALL